MNILIKILLSSTLFFIISCSSSYENLTKNRFEPKSELSKYLYEEYKKKAIFEAKKMHDWNSAKLYSEKAISSANGEKILPQKINYWKTSTNHRAELIVAYNNLITVYEKGADLDPLNLAKAISSLDCWSEQSEENWQFDDIKECKDNFLYAIHNIYESINKNKILKLNSKENKKLNDSTTVVTKDKNEKILQIVYFDFDKAELTLVAIKKIGEFLKKNKDTIKKFLILGYTDTVGTNDYNYKLSILRANKVKKILIQLGIDSNNINIIGKGEKDLRIQTEDEISHPINRRAEIRPLN